MKTLNLDVDFQVPNPSNTWTTDQNFADEKPVSPAGMEKVNTNNDDVIDAVINVAKQTKDMVVDESKTLAPDVADTFRESAGRLDQTKEIIKGVPNSYLYWGIVVLGGALIYSALTKDARKQNRLNRNFFQSYLKAEKLD